MPSANPCELSLLLTLCIHTQVTLAVAGGSLALSSSAGVTFSRGTAAGGDAALAFTGSLAAVNAALSALTYTPAPDYNSQHHAELLRISAAQLPAATDSSSEPATLAVLPILVTPVDDVPVVVVPQYQRLRLGSIGLDPLGSAVWGARRVTLQLRVDSPASALALLPAAAAAPAAVAAAFALVTFVNSTAAAVQQLGAFGRSVALSGLASDVASALALTDLTCVRAAGFSGGDAVHVSVVESDATTGAALPSALAAEATLELWLSTLSSAAQSALPYIGSLRLGGDHSDAQLLVTGGGFAQYAAAAAAAATPPLLCQYGSLSAPAAVLNDTALLCPVPVAALAAAAAASSTAPAAGGFHTLVRLTNGLDFWSNAVAHYIAQAPQLLSVLPAAVPACGGSSIVLTAAAPVMTASPVCIFGSSAAAAALVVVVPAQWRTPQSVVCTVPQWPPTTAATSSAAAVAAPVAVPVRLAAAHAAAGLASNAVTVLFTPAPAVHSVTPLLGSSAGGAVLTVSGSGFAAALPLVCSIGGVLAEPLAVISDSELQCVVPARETAAAVAVPPYQLELASSDNSSSIITGADDVLVDGDATALSLVSYCYTTTLLTSVAYMHTYVLQL
jgi:IPT/TIG domain